MTHRDYPNIHRSGLLLDHRTQTPTPQTLALPPLEESLQEKQKEINNIKSLCGGLKSYYLNSATAQHPIHLSSNKRASNVHHSYMVAPYLLS